MPHLYTLPADYQHATGMPIDKTVMFTDAKGTPWLMIDTHGVMTIAAGYASDGCSPKYAFKRWIIGTPDGSVCPFCKLPETYYAFFVHDALCQFADHKDMPWSRAQIDKIFYNVLKRDQFKWAKFYYWAVVKLGPIHKRLSAQK